MLWHHDMQTLLLVHKKPTGYTHTLIIGLPPNLLIVGNYASLGLEGHRPLGSAQKEWCWSTGQSIVDVVSLHS